MARFAHTARVVYRATKVAWVAIDVGKGLCMMDIEHIKDENTAQTHNNWRAEEVQDPVRDAEAIK